MPTVTTFARPPPHQPSIAEPREATDRVRPARGSTPSLLRAHRSRSARAKSLGGQVMMPGMDIPNIGRIAVIADDQGAAIGLFQPAT